MLRKKRSAAKSNSLSAQGTIKEPFGKRFAKKSIAQGTIEYLVVVAVVIVLALIVVVVIFGSSDKSSDTVVSAVRLSMKSGAIGFAELAGDVNGDMLVSLLNNTGEFIYIQMISLIGKNGTYSRSFSNAQVAPGASALFFLDSFPECKCTTPGETLICEFSIQYQSVSGLVKNFLLKAVVDCVADVDENHGNPFTPTCWSENTACLIGANCCGGVCTLGLCGPGGQDQGCASGYNDCDGNSSNGCETLGACPVCTVDANCVDARECTVDTCVGGQCVNDATSCLPLNLSSITDCNTLQNMQNNLDGNYVLANDIDCSLFNWIPVGDSNAPFAGILDGNNHTIQNLVAMYGNSQLAVVDENSRIDNYGIFGAINYAQINNLFVIQSEATGYFSVGMLAGDANNSTISNCHVQANQVFGSSYVGGLVGFAENTTISDSNFSGPIISGYFSNIYTSLQDPSSYLFNEGIPYSAGGIAGYFKNGTINDVNVTLQIIGVSHVGGLVGLLSDSNVSGAWVRTVSPQSILLPSYAVDGIFSVGGIAGLAKNSTIGSAHFIGTVRGIMRVGGIVGSQINGSMTAVNSDLNIIGTNNVDSVAGRILNTTLSTTYGTGVGYLQISDSYVTTLSLQKYLNAPSNIESVSNAVSDINYGNFSYSNPRVVLNCTDLEDMNSVLDGNYYLAQDVNCSQIVSFASVGSCINAATCGGYSSLDENTIFLGSLRGKSNITDLTGNLFGCSTSSEIEPNLTSGNKVACDYSSINPQTQAIGSWWGYYFGNTPWFVYKWYWSGYPLWWQWPGAGYAYWDWSYWNGFSSWYRSYGYGPNYYCGGSYNYSYGDSGTITNPIKIYDCPGLQNITNNLDANYRIMRDINCADYNFVPIGTVGYCNEDGNSMGMDEAPCAYIGETSCEAIRYCMCDQDHDGCNADDPNWMNGNNYSEPECLYCNNQGNNTCDPHSYSSGCQSTWNIEAPFKGSINGGGFVISNLTINRGYVNKQNYVGMIGYGKNATFKNLKFVGASLTSSPSNLPGGDGGLWSMPHLAAGVVAGSCDSCAFTNINVDGSVVLSFGSNSFGAAAGLITGYGYWSNYYNLFSSGSVTLSETAGASSYTPESGAGGLIGASRNESITRAGSTADVLYTLTGPVSLNGYVGGLVGTAYSSNLYRGYHVGDVTGSGSLCNLVDDMASGCMFAGGIMGGRYDTSDYPPGGLVSTSYNIGNVTGDLAGALAGSASVTYSYADGNVIGIFGAATTSGALYGYGAQYVYTRVTVTAPRKAGVSAIRCQPACSASNYIYWDSGLFSNPDLCLAGCGGQDYNGEGYMLTSSQLRDVNVMPSAFSSGEFCMCSGDYPRLAWETGVDPTCDCAKPITNCIDLQNMNLFPKAKFYLAQNIDCDSGNWNYWNAFVPVGDYAAPFMGELDGRGNSISNFKVGKVLNNEYGGSPFVGLFGIAIGAKIHDLTIHYADVNVPYYRVGGTVVGYGEDVNITNVHVDGNVTQRSNYLYGCGYNDWPSIGGLIGKGSGLITNSSFNGIVGNNGANLGGAYGGLAGTFLGPITNSNTQGIVSGANASYDGYVGGLVGYYSNYYNSYSTGITNSYSQMDVNGFFAGGLVGELVSGTITTSNYVGEITCPNWGLCGGLIGKTGNQNILSYSNYPRITSSYADSNIIGANSDAIGGLVGSHYGYYYNYWWGYNWGNFSIADSNFSGNIQGGKNVGGIIGSFQGLQTYIDAALDNLKVTANISGSQSVGGIAGSIQTSPYYITKDAPWWPAWFRSRADYGIYSEKYWYELLTTDTNEPTSVSPYHTEGYVGSTIKTQGLDFSGTLSATSNWVNIGGLFGIGSNLWVHESKAAGTINRYGSWMKSGGLIGELHNSYVTTSASSINFTDNNSSDNVTISGGLMGESYYSYIGSSYYSGDLNYSWNNSLWAASAFVARAYSSYLTAVLFIGQNSGNKEIRPIASWTNQCANDYSCYGVSVGNVYWDSTRVNMQNDFCTYAQQISSRWTKLTSASCYSMSALTTVQAKQQSYYPGLTFTPSYWSICEGTTYPWLSWEGRSC